MAASHKSCRCFVYVDTAIACSLFRCELNYIFSSAEWTEIAVAIAAYTRTVLERAV